MKICCISDTHDSHLELTLPDADMLIHAGDFGDGQERNSIEFLKWFNKQPHFYKILIAGNHDWLCERNPRRWNELMEQYAPDCIYLEDSGVTLEGYKIWGSPVTPRFHDWAFNRDRGPHIEGHWDLIPSDVDILITHGPTNGILDAVPSDITNPHARIEYVGCQNLEKTIRTRLRDLKLHVFGHVHINGGMLDIVENVKYVNASVIDENYVVVNDPVIVEL